MRHLPFLLLGALLVALSVTAQVNAGTVVKAPIVQFVPAPPDGPCDADHIGDIEIKHGVWYECVCEQRVFVEPACDWYENTDPMEDPQALKKLKRASKRIVRVKDGVLYVPRIRPVIA